MMFLAFVMFSVFIVGLAQGRVLPTPLKSEEGEEELSGVTVVARDENVDDDHHRPMIYSSSLTLSSSSLIELSACECYFAAYEKRDAAKRNAEKTPVGRVAAIRKGILSSGLKMPGNTLVARKRTVRAAVESEVLSTVRVE